MWSFLQRCGNLHQGEMMIFPDDSLQSLILPSDWWVENQKKKLCRGALIYTFVPYVDQIPYSFEPIGRKHAEQHDKAIVKVAPLLVDQPLKQVELPVAAMPLYNKEVWTAYRAKGRPCLVLREASQSVPKELTRGKSNHSVAPTLLLAPYYGADENSKRAGYSEEFRTRVRHCEYPQFLWDKLPINGSDESILRLDHMLSSGAHHQAYKISEYKLSEEAMGIVDEQINWLIYGGLSKDSIILDYRELIEQSSL